MRLFTMIFAVAIALLVLASHHQAEETTAVQHPVAAAQQGMTAVQANVQAGVRNLQKRGEAAANQLTVPVTGAVHAVTAKRAGIAVWVGHIGVKIADAAQVAATMIFTMVVSALFMVWGLAIWASSFVIEHLFGPELQYDYATYDQAVRVLAAIMLGATGFLMSGPVYTLWKMRHISSARNAPRSMR